jgi:glycosyltransferase involved in cell wall biosynthesis
MGLEAQMVRSAASDVSRPLARLAWFAPLPPATTGISQYNVELLPGLAELYDIDVFVDERPDRHVHPPHVSVQAAHDFLWRHVKQPYDLVVYHLGNSPYHDYMWPYLVRYPGLVVLHDGQLHHARGRYLLRHRRDDDYRAEFAFNHPDASGDLAELGVAGLLGSLTYLFPMRRIVVERSRLLVVHNEWLAEQIREQHPRVAVAVVGMGVPDRAARPEARETVRARHGIPAGSIVFGAFGGVTPEKRIPQAISALAAIAAAQPDARLLLVGDSVEHYDAAKQADAAGVADRVTLAGYVPQDQLADYLSATDVCLCMRWPSSRETSAAWLRCLAAGRPTVITDLVHTVNVPALDPRNWTILHAPGAAAGTGEETSAACVSIDILDEDHSLRLAMRRLAADARLRSAIGHAARRLWEDQFGLARMVAGYRQAIERVLTSRLEPVAPLRDLPCHFTVDGAEQARRLMTSCGIESARPGGVWGVDLEAERRPRA